VLFSTVVPIFFSKCIRVLVRVRMHGRNDAVI
jgi:hypothetical protein